MPPELPLLERASELSDLRDSIDAARRGEGRLVVVEGEAGIGKSTLLAAAAREARALGVRICRGRGSELERLHPFGVAVGLLEDLVATWGDAVLAGPASAARALFPVPGRSPGANSPAAAAPAAPSDPFATVHGLCWLVLNAAEREPLLLLVDDAQWADAATLRFLHYLANRIAELPVTIVAAFRTGIASPTREAELLRTMREARLVRPAPLSQEGVVRLLEAALSPVPPGLAEAVHRASRGNPFYATALVQEALRRERAGEPHDGWLPMPDSPRWEGPLVPATIARAVAVRLDQLGSAARSLAEAVAVLDDAADLDLAARLAGVVPEEAAGIARALVDEGILEAESGLAFAHPIVRDAVYGAIPAVVRQRLHRRAAALLSEAGAPRGAQAAQLVEAERTGDLHAVDVLLAAASDAVDRGEPAAAARLLERALEEPPGPERRADVLIALGRAEATLGAAGAVDRLRSALAGIDDPRRRAELLLDVGRILIARTEWVEATEVLADGLRELGVEPGVAPPADLDPAVRPLLERLKAEFVSAAWVTVQRRPEAEAMLARMLADTQRGPVQRSLSLWVAWQQMTVVSAPSAELAGTVLRTVDEVPIDDLVREGQAVEVASGVLLATDELEAEADLLTRAIAAAERAHLFGRVAMYAYCRAWPRYHLGQLQYAIADAQAALAGGELGWEIFLPAARAVLALGLIERGELDAAEEAARLDAGTWGHRIDYQIVLPVARGRLRLARGDAEGALRELSVAEASPAGSMTRALVLADWRSWKAVALARLGRREEARAVAAELVATARASGTAWTLGGALRVAGVADGGAGGIEMLREAVAILERTPVALERVRAEVALGRSLVRLGRRAEARDVLGRAMEGAHRIGAIALLEQARDEMRLAGSRPRRFALTGLEALTPAERRVAELAAAGRTNREIAQALFVTPKAVEYHLSNAYPKLGVASRAELRTIDGLGDREEGAA